jgi:hypothetical protein
MNLSIMHFTYLGVALFKSVGGVVSASDYQEVAGSIFKLNYSGDGFI